MSRTINCDRDGYEHVTVKLPDEWLGKHARIRDEAIREAVKQFPDSAFFVNVCVCFALMENIEGVKALEGPPENWVIEDVPLPVLAWLEEAVVDDFLASFQSTNPTLPAFTKALQEAMALSDIPGIRKNRLP